MSVIAWYSPYHVSHETFHELVCDDRQTECHYRSLVTNSSCHEHTRMWNVIQTRMWRQTDGMSPVTLVCLSSHSYVTPYVSCHIRVCMMIPGVSSLWVRDKRPVMTFMRECDKRHTERGLSVCLLSLVTYSPHVSRQSMWRETRDIRRVWQETYGVWQEEFVTRDL